MLCYSKYISNIYIYIGIHVASAVYFRLSRQLTMNLAVYWLCVAVLLSCNVLVQSEITTQYPTDPQDWSLFPYGAGDVELPDEDNLNFNVDGLIQSFTYFGTSYDALTVSIQRFLLK